MSVGAIARLYALDPECGWNYHAAAPLAVRGSLAAVNVPL
jgi:hypothetical protein